MIGEIMPKDFIKAGRDEQLQIIKELAADRLSPREKTKNYSYADIESVACGIVRLDDAALAKQLIEELAKIALKQKVYIDRPVKNLGEARFYAKYDIWEIVGTCSQSWPNQKFCQFFDISKKDIERFREVSNEIKQGAFAAALGRRSFEVVLGVR